MRLLGWQVADNSVEPNAVMGNSRPSVTKGKSSEAKEAQNYHPVLDELRKRQTFVCPFDATWRGIGGSSQEANAIIDGVCKRLISM